MICRSGPRGVEPRPAGRRPAGAASPPIPCFKTRSYIESDNASDPEKNKNKNLKKTHKKIKKNANKNEKNKRLKPDT